MFRRIWFTIIGICVAIVGGFLTSPAHAQNNAIWTAQYFNNTALAGAPSTTGTLSNLGVGWGYNAPVSGVSADNWSARFNTTAYFSTGTYRFTVHADDAFRLYVHSQLLIDTFNNPRPDQTVSVDMPMAGGSAGIQVDFLEYVGPAFLYVSWQQVGGSVPPTPTPTNPSESRVVINTGMLNVRSAPFIGDNVVTKVPQNATYPVTGRTAASDWYQIYVGPATTGWVSARYVIASNTAGVPVINTQVTAPNTPTTSTGFSLRSNANVNIRSGAGVNYSRLGILPYNRTASILARNSSNTWWFVSYGGVTGWVIAQYVILPWNINYGQIPVR